MFDVSSDEMTSEPLHEVLLLLAVPLLLQNFVRVALQIVDLFWLGRLSADAVSAAGLVIPIVAFLVAIVNAAPFIGTQILVSQRIGNDDRRGASRATFTGLALGVGLGVVAGGLVYVGARPLLELLATIQPGNTDSHVIELAAGYLKIIALGVFVAAIGDVIEGVFIGSGDSRASLYQNLSTVAVNVLLDPFLIFGFGPFPALGMEGAALATVAGYFGGALLGVGLIARGRGDGLFSRSGVTLRLSEARELLSVGIPSGFRYIAIQSAQITLTVIVFVAGGSTALAAYLVGSRVSSLAYTPANGLKQALQTVVGQNLGASCIRRAERVTWVGVAIATVGVGVLGITQWSIPGFVTTLLVPKAGPTEFELAIKHLRIYAYSYPAIGALLLLQGGFVGARRTRTSMVASFVQHWGIRLPLAATSVYFGYGVVGIFWAISISNIVTAVGLAGYYVHSSHGGMFDRAATDVESSS